MDVEYISNSCYASATIPGRWFFHIRTKKVMLRLNSDSLIPYRFIDSDGCIHEFNNKNNDLFFIIGFSCLCHDETKDSNKNIYDINSIPWGAEIGSTVRYWPTKESKCGEDNIYIKTNEKNKFVHLKTATEFILESGYIQFYNYKVVF